MARKKLSDLTVIDAKIDKPTPTTLEQILGGTGKKEYGTLEESEYIKELEEMNLAELQSHALSRSLIPKDDRRLLTQRLLNVFRSHVMKYKSNKASVISKSNKKPEKISKEVAKILALGKN